MLITRSAHHAFIVIFIIMLIVPAVWPSELAMPAQAQSIEQQHQQELLLPEITPAMQGQPVDVPVSFKQLCWAPDEARHSVRVYHDDGSSLEELECQIYDLERTNNEYITSCNLVFLLQGPGDYILAYDSSETEAPGYTDHVSVGEGSYYYEPVPGYSIDLDYYSIMDDTDIVYGIGQGGDFFGIDMAQKVIKQLPGSQTFDVQHWGQLASYAFFWYEDRDKGTDEQLVSKQVVVDGPLMARVGIESTSDDEKVTTTAYYTYYHSPGSEKRLMTAVTHEVHEQCEIEGLEEEDGIYAYLLTVRARSSSIDKLNLGVIPPYLHISTEDGTIHEYRLDQNPESTDYKWLLDTRDDIDIGRPAWFSIDNGDSGTAYALIFNTSTPASTDTRPGIQVRAVGRQEVSIPGLEVDGGGISGGRNAYEQGGAHDLTIPAGFTARFTAEFYAAQQDGVTAVQQEVATYEALKECRICTGTGITGEAADRYQLTVTPHLAPSVPLAPALSLLTGLTLPTTTVELWRNDTLISSSVASRVPLDIDAPLGLDLRNATLFKTAVFPRIPAGRYVIRVTGGLDGQRYIGSQPITITENTSTHIFCRLEGTLTVAMQDQNNEGIDGVKMQLLTDNAAIAFNTTDSDGTAMLRAPMPGSYHLQAIYKGFILHEQEIQLPHLNAVEAIVELHDLDVTITDRLGMPPGVTLQPVLTSRDMTTPILLTGTDRGGGQYHYEYLPTGSYTLRLRYKSFLLERDITIPASTIDVTFPAVYTLGITTRNARGMSQDYTIEITRYGRVIETDELPPGQYHVTAYDDNEVVAERNVFITGDTSIQMVTRQQPLFPLLSSIAIILAAAGFMLLLRRNGQLSLQRLLLITSAALLLIAPLHAWWQLDGNHGALDVTTQVYLLPAEMVTTGSAPSYTGGDIADLPGLFNTMGATVAGLFIIAAVLLAVYQLKRQWWIPLLAGITGLAGIAVFTVGMSTAADVITGSLWGSGNVSIALAGYDAGSVAASWSPGLGFYLALAGVTLLLVSLRTQLLRVLQWLQRRIPTF